MNKKKLWSVAKTLLKVVVTGVLLYFVARKIDLRELRALLFSSNPFYIILAFLFYGGSLLIASWRSLGLLRNIGLDLGYWYYFKLYMIGVLYNVILPGGVGGDGYKIYILRKKYQLSTRRLFLAMLFDRLSGLWAIGFITVSLIIFIPKIAIHPTIPLLLLTGGTVLYYFVMRRFFRDYSRNFLQTHLKSGVLQSMQMMVVICLLLSQRFDGKFSPYLFSFQVSTLAANIPASLGGAGVREMTMMGVADFFGMNRNLAVYLSVSFYLISTLIALTGIFFTCLSREFEAAPSQEEVEAFEKEADGSNS
jgi:uncharacterized membrane protein YbhN (UPF0104 family)